MSFILDALKKSELERQRQAIPGLVDTPSVRSKGGLPVWAIALGVLLAVNLVIVTWLLLHNALTAAPTQPGHAESGAAPAAKVAANGTGAGAGAGAGAAQETGAAAARATEHFSPLDPAPEYAPEIPVPGKTPESAVAPALRVVPGSAPTAHTHEPLLNEDDYKPADDEVLPTINELSLSGSHSLPELHLDVHVYASKPADRFVYINMRKYHEGATLEEGPVIEHIRRDGVVLNYQGLRFLLPRQ